MQSGSASWDCSRTRRTCSRHEDNRVGRGKNILGVYIVFGLCFSFVGPLHRRFGSLCCLPLLFLFFYLFVTCFTPLPTIQLAGRLHYSLGIAFHTYPLFISCYFIGIPSPIWFYNITESTSLMFHVLRIPERISCNWQVNQKSWLCIMLTRGSKKSE